MKKKVKPKIGDLFLVPFENVKFGVGRILKINEATLFVELYKIKPLNDPAEFNIDQVNLNEVVYKKWCYDEGIRKGEWPVVGHLAVKHPIHMPEFWRKSSDGKYYLIPGSDTHEGDWDNLRVVEKRKKSGMPSLTELAI